MRCTFSARFTAWNQVEKARTRSRASAGGRSRTQAASSARASLSPARARIAATRSSSTSSNSCSPPCSRRISPTRAPSACTSSRSGSCFGGKCRSLRFTLSVPGVGLEREIGALRAHHAEALSGGRLHHVPAAHRADAFCAEPLEPRHLRLDIVGFDVEVHAALVPDPLHLEMRLVGSGGEGTVLRVGGVRRRTQLEAEGGAPEARGGLQVVALAVDDETCETALVHDLKS